MKIRTRIQRAIERLPEGASKPLVHIPFSIRLGRSYSVTRAAIADEEMTRLAFEARGKWERLRQLVGYAQQNVPCYEQIYRERGFDAGSLRSWDDWQRVPIVTKADFQRFPLSDRCARGVPGTKINTGGTSGQPLEFLVDNGALGREWAHMHHMWVSRGYKTTHPKLTLRGKHFGPGTALRYNAINNEYLANSALPMHRIVEAVVRLSQRVPIRWVHGYPSLTAEFALAVDSLPDAGKRALRSALHGVLLASEYPAPQYRAPIAQILSTNVLSWYGHSEMVLIAKETAEGVYESFPTMGFAESVPDHDGSNRLVCTSLGNTAHPFVRYDTGDRIEPVSSRRGALEFRIKEGRIGEFIVDRKGDRHALTAIVFGRHHAAFELASHIQVHQAADGKVTFVVTPRDPGTDTAAISSQLDMKGLDIEWSVRVVEAPVRTKSGKIKFLLATGDIPPR
jgi:phenylacetate-CoA ligase